MVYDLVSVEFHTYLYIWGIYILFPSQGRVSCVNIRHKHAATMRSAFSTISTILRLQNSAGHISLSGKFKTNPMSY